MAFVDGENLTVRFEKELSNGRTARTAEPRSMSPFSPFPGVARDPGRFAWSPATIFNIPGHDELLRTHYYTTFSGSPDAMDTFVETLSAQRVNRYQDSGQTIVRERMPLVPRVFLKSSRSTKTKSVDINLTVDMLEYVKQNAVDAIYLVTGDVDYLPLIQSVMRSGKKVYIAALSSGLSPRLRHSADMFINLDNVFRSSAGCDSAGNLTARPSCGPLELEGVMAKDGASRYVAGRSDRWLKIKTAAGAERESKRRR